MGKSNLWGKLEVLEVDLKSHPCLYSEVPHGSGDAIIVYDARLRLGVEQVASATNKVHAGIVEAHGAVLKEQRQLYLRGFIDKLFSCAIIIADI